MKHKADNYNHYSACHERWKVLANRKLKVKQPDEETVKQCMTCAYYIKLTGVFGQDYGVCSNPVSSYDSKLMFEHDGCDKYVYAQDYG